MRFLQEAGKKATGKGKAVGGRNHTEALETKRADERAQGGCARSTDIYGAEYSVREPKSKRGDSLDTASSRATGNMPSIALITNKSCSSISSLYPVLQPSQETVSFPRKKWKRSRPLIGILLMVDVTSTVHLSYGNQQMR